MELIIDPNQESTLSFSNRGKRNQNQVNFDVSEVKTMYLNNPTYTIDGATGDILIRTSPPQHIRDYIESHAKDIDGYYPNPLGLQDSELAELLDDVVSIKFGGVEIREDTTAYDILRAGGDISSLLI